MGAAGGDIMKSVILAAASAVAILSAAPASAAQVVYTFAGTFSGTASGQTFTDQQVTFNATGDTDTARTDDATGFKLVDLSSVTASMGETVVFSLTEATTFAVRQSGSIAGILDRAITKQYFAFETPGLATYDGTATFSETLASQGYGSQGTFFSSVAGPSSITSVANLRFSAVVGAQDAVPEPATWGLMLAGFGLVGGALRVRRRTAVVSVA